MNEENNHDKKTGETRKKPVFYAALYSCVGLMLAVSAVIGYFNFRAVNNSADLPPDTQGAAITTTADPNDAVAVSGGREAPLSKATQTPKPSPTPPVKTVPAVTTAPTAVPSPATQGKNDAILIPPPDYSYEVGSEISVGAHDTPDETGGIMSVDVVEDVNKNETVTAAEPPAPKTFAAFTDMDEMDWPLVGDIAMVYSKDHTVYDKTLDLRRTNDTLCIEANLFDEVRAAAAGRVTDISFTYEDGVMITLDHGNGWSTTYSQLSDDILVSLDDVVNTGDALGYIGEPSIYSVMLGSHLQFEVALDDAPVNPEEVLAALN